MKLRPLLLLCWFLTGTAAAQSNDLDRIPTQASAQAPSSASSDSGRIYLENVLTAMSKRSGLVVPLPSSSSTPDWQERLFLDIRKEWSLGDGLRAAYSGRLNLRAENDLPFPRHLNLIHDLREAYLGWEPVERVYLDVGRINLKNGVALGFNPTDFFKTRAVVEPLSADPSVQREDRLGTLMARLQYVGNGVTLLAAFAPAIESVSPIYGNRNLPSFDPMFDRTNAHMRTLLKASADLGEGVTPELLVYREGSRTMFGANVTRDLGRDVVAYAEWAGGRRANLIEQALQFGTRTGTLPASVARSFATDPRRHFQSDLAIGASYTTESKITFNLEYHYAQGAFGAGDWDRWFGNRTVSSGTLWFLRSYAADQQAPANRHALFLRADWVDALVRNLDVTGFIRTDLPDRSSLLQFTADYHLSDRWTVGGLVSANLGSARTEFGSLQQAGTVLFKVARYF
ncbi:hypothetical protein [Roseiterribacter gracilis]|uniref:Alginate export domain-containing protein n=1 Tax=Roseiterribacter gracilis TaxID=2812848 RepID=A0A8S8XCL3_9PROT|nr:hypothetical protein TMPK1_39750 [Rhodospirillales bacterium TMPK1]